MATLQDKRKVDNELQRLGLGKLSDPRLFDQMAFLVRNHDHFRGMLMHETQFDRSEMYKCLAPRLRFTAKPLADYEAESKRLAEHKQLPQYNSATLEAKDMSVYHHKSEEFREQEAKPDGEYERDQRIAKAAEKEIARQMREEGAKYQLRLVCRQCTREQVFRVKRKPAAYKLARQDGWGFKPGDSTALCFACKPKTVN